MSIALLATCAAAQEAGWPQWGGPARDFRLPAAALAEQWPAGGPPERWTRPVGGGHGGIAVVGGELYTLVRRGDREIDVALDADTGTIRWEGSTLTPERELDYGMGPFSTPTVRGAHVLFLGVAGELRCRRRADGELVWRRDLAKDFPGSRRDRGFAANPVAHGDLVAVLVGAPGAAAVALDAATGDTVWQRHDFGLDYASPIVIERDGMTELVCQFENELVGLRLSDGELAWRLPSDGERTRHVITPLDLGGALLASTTHAARRVEIGANGATAEWRNRRLRPQVGNVVHARHCGLVLGASSPFTGALIVALDAETGERRWRSRDIDAGFLWLVGDEVFGLSRDGELVQARCDRDGLTVRNRCRPFTGDKIWSAPAMVGARLYFKGDGRIRALDLSR